MKHKILQEKDIEKSGGMQVVMPLDLGMRIETEESVRTLMEVTERIDYSELIGTYQRQPRQSEATPKQMLQIEVLGFMLWQASAPEPFYTDRGSVWDFETGLWLPAFPAPR